MNTLQDRYKKATGAIKTGTRTALPRCDVTKNYRQRIVRVLEETYAGLTWVA